MQPRLLAFTFAGLFFCTHSSSQAGTPDISFGVNGVVKISVPLNHSETDFEAKHITQQKDGKFIVEAEAHRLNPDFFSNAYLYRFKNNGRLDSSFGLDGRINI